MFKRVIPFGTIVSFLFFAPVAYAQDAQEGINQTGPNAHGNVVNNITNNNYYGGLGNAEKKTLAESDPMVPPPPAHYGRLGNAEKKTPPQWWDPIAPSPYLTPPPDPPGNAGQQSQ
jgi:hypothetical protein